MSGLINCGLRGDQLHGLRSRYSRGLNDGGLFVEHEVATKFAHQLDSLVPEHAPFFLTYVYVVRASATD
jgi:hypothetical protein